MLREPNGRRVNDDEEEGEEEEGCEYLGFKCFLEHQGNISCCYVRLITWGFFF